MAKKKSSNKTIIILIVGIALILVVAVVGKQQGWVGQKKVIEVELVEAGNESITEKVSASGMVQPVTEVKLSPDVAGEIIDLTIEEGDSVALGDLLVKIKPDNWESALERAKAMLNQQKANYHSSLAALEKAKANITRAEADYNRQKQLFDEKVISVADWQMAEQNYEVAKNDLESARQNVQASNFIVKSSEASVREAEENVRLTNVLAPMTGIVSKLDVEKGERVVGTQQMAGTEMMRIADLNKMEVRVDVNENDIIRVALGDTAIIDVDAYTHLDKEFRGVVTQIANTANAKVSTDAVTEFQVRILILNDSYQDLVNEGKTYPFRPGMTASVEIITEKKDDVLAIPLGAVTTRDPNEKDRKSDSEEGEEEAREVEMVEVIFVLKDGVAEMREVKTGISDYDNIEILEGLEQGEKVVSGPFLVVSKRLKDGDAIGGDDEEEEKEEEASDKEEVETS